MLYVWYPKKRTDLNVIHEENNVIEKEELARVKAQLKQGKHTCLIMRMEHPRAYEIHGVLQDSRQQITRLLIRLPSTDHKTLDKTPVNRSQDS